MGAQSLKVLNWIPHGDSEFFLCSTLMTKRKTSFSIFFSGNTLEVAHTADITSVKGLSKFALGELFVLPHTFG